MINNVTKNHGTFLKVWKMDAISLFKVASLLFRFFEKHDPIICADYPQIGCCKNEMVLPILMWTHKAGTNHLML